jgi:hypothetical protein
MAFFKQSIIPDANCCISCSVKYTLIKKETNLPITSCDFGIRVNWTEQEMQQFASGIIDCLKKAIYTAKHLQ